MPRDAAARSTLFSVFAKLVREEGVFAQWNGVPVSIWLVSNPIIQFTLYVQSAFLQCIFVTI